MSRSGLTLTGAVGAERLGIDRALGLDLGELAEDHLGRFRGEDEVGVFDAGPDKLHEAVALVVCIIRLAWRGHLLNVAAVGTRALRCSGLGGDEPVAYILEAGALVFLLGLAGVGLADGRDVVQKELEP